MSSPWQFRGFIRGDDGDLPQLITFQQNCKIGALLATVSHKMLCTWGGGGAAAVR